MDDDDDTFFFFSQDLSNKDMKRDLYIISQVIRTGKLSYVGGNNSCRNAWNNFVKFIMCTFINLKWAFLIMWRTRLWLQVECCWMTVRRVLRTSSTVDRMAVRSWPWATCCRPSQSSKRRKILSLKCTRKCLHSQITRQEKILRVHRK